MTKGKILDNSLFTDEDYNLWLLISFTRDAILQARQKELDQYSTTSRQVGVLFIIQVIGDEATPAEISRWIFRKPSSVSELLDRMEKQGLVKKVKDLDKKHLIRVVLTKKGHEVYKKSTDRESIHRIMSSLSKDKLRNLSSHLQTIRNKALKELGIEKEMPFPPRQ